MDAFYLNQNVSGPGLEVVPISTWEVLIGTPRVSIGPLKWWAQFPVLVCFGLFFFYGFSKSEIALGRIFNSYSKINPFYFDNQVFKTI